MVCGTNGYSYLRLGQVWPTISEDTLATQDTAYGFQTF